MGSTVGDLIAAAAVACSLALLVLVGLAVRRSGGVRQLDDRAYESRFGWLMPGGLLYKLGRRDGPEKRRWWPYLLDWPLGGWLYNGGRRRTEGESRKSK